MAHHVVGPGDEVGSPLDVGDGALALMNNTCLPAIQPVPFIQKQLREGKKNSFRLYSAGSFTTLPAEGSR